MPSHTPTSARALLLALVFACGSTLAPSQAHADGAREAPLTPNPGVLSLRTGDVLVANLVNLLSDAALPAWQHPAHVLVLDGPLTSERTVQLATAGAVVLSPMPQAAALVSLQASDAAKAEATRALLLALPFVRVLTPVNPSWKIDPQLAKGQSEFSFETGDRLALQAKGEVLALASFVPGLTPREARAALEPLIAKLAARGSVLSVLSETTAPGLAFDETSLVLRMRATDVGALASVPALLFAEHAPEFATRSNASTRWSVQSTTLNATPFYDRGLTGAGEILGLLDDPFNTSHCSVFDVQPIGPAHRKLLAYNGSAGNITHGIHVATTLAGDDTSDPNLRGVAYQARMVFNNLPSFGEANVFGRFELHRTQGAFIHNNSWGNASTTSYDSTCRAFDNFMWTNEDQLLVVSAANATTIRNPENCKNAIAVSAIRSFPTLNEYCQGGRGPTSDGRRKPEVMAPGCSIASGGGAPCSVALLTGTSMATPAVSGLAALMRQYFLQGFTRSGQASAGEGFVPSGALLRAAVIHSAQDVTGPAGYPSDQEGWGRIVGETVAFFAGDARTLIVRDVRRASPQALSTNQSFVLPIDVQSGQELRVTLAFTDAPGAILSADPVVNNLNLVLTSPSGDQFLGNVFASGQSTTGGSADARNNLEQVHLRTPEAGVWTISVLAPVVQVGPQGFALVVSGAVSEANACDSIDFNNNTLFPEDQDLLDFLSVLTGGPCSEGNTCSDIDFNNDGLFPSDDDLVAFLTVLAGGDCP
jgi:hypothetical protein